MIVVLTHGEMRIEYTGDNAMSNAVADNNEIFDGAGRLRAIFSDLECHQAEAMAGCFH
jgi:hypothetical protein